MRPWRAVVRKELLDSLRDRRSVISVMLFPLMGPLLLWMLAEVVAERRTLPERVEVAALGIGRAPRLEAHLARHGVRLAPAPESFRAAVEAGELSAVLEIPEGFGDDFSAGRTGKLRLWLDRSSDEGAAEIARVQELVAAYGQRIGALRLIVRGVSPEVASPVVVEVVDLSTPQRLAARLLEMIPLFLVIAALIGGMNVATDATAGERERGSLEPLLLNPTSRRTLVLGKWAVTTLFCGAVAGLTAVAFAVTLRHVGLEEVGLQVDLGVGRLALMALVLAPLCGFAGALLLLVATFARSYKEAQLYLSLLLMAPAGGSVVLLLSPARPSLAAMFAPALAQQLLISDLLRGEPPRPGLYLAAGASALLFGIVAIWGTAALLCRERIVFGR